MRWLFTSGGRSIGALATLLPMNIQDQFPLVLTGLISLLSKGLFFFFLLLFAFIFCGIYSQAISFCFFSFFWDIFFFCATSSSGLGTICSFSVRIISMWQGELVGVDPTMSSVSPAPHLGGFVHLDVLNDQRIYI